MERTMRKTEPRPINWNNNQERKDTERKEAEKRLDESIKQEKLKKK